MRYQIIKTKGLPLRQMLRGKVHPGAVLLTTDAGVQRACELAKEIIQGVTCFPGQLEPVEEVLVRPMDTEPGGARYFHRRWLGGAYAWRMPCGNWETCQNPDGPVTVHYAAPTKNPDRRGLTICAHCRARQGNTQRQRERTGETNRTRRKKALEATVPEAASAE